VGCLSAAGAQDRVFVAFADRGVDRETEGVGRAAIAQPTRWDLLAAWQDAGCVGEAAAVAECTVSSWGRCVPACCGSLQVIESRVGWGMAGMRPLCRWPVSGALWSTGNPR
jgi:hypothetical protein